MADPEQGKTYSLWVWEDRANGRPMESGVWLAPFPTDMTVAAEGFPIGTAAVAGNSHNRDPRQTLIIQLRDAINGFVPYHVPFSAIKGGYQPVGAAHVLLHRDFPWQQSQLRVMAVDTEGRLLRVYTWLYLVQRSYRWDGKWVAV